MLAPGTKALFDFINTQKAAKFIGGSAGGAWRATHARPAQKAYRKYLKGTMSQRAIASVRAHPGRVALGAGAVAGVSAMPGSNRSKRNQNSRALRNIRKSQADALSGMQPFVPSTRNIHPKSSGGFTI